MRVKNVPHPPNAKSLNLTMEKIPFLNQFKGKKRLKPVLNTLIKSQVFSEIFIYMQ